MRFLFTTKLMKILSLNAVVLVVLHLVFQFAIVYIYKQDVGGFFDLVNRFDFDDENSVTTWFSQLLFLIIAMLAWLSARYEKNKDKKNFWFGLSVVAILISIDEVGSFHEWLLQNIHVFMFYDDSSSFLSNAWFVLLPFIALFCGFALIKIYKTLDRTSFKFLSLALAVFVIGSVFVDIATSLIDSGGFIMGGIVVAIEESLEITAALIVIYILSKNLETNQSRKIKELAKALS